MATMTVFRIIVTVILITVRPIEAFAPAQKSLPSASSSRLAPFCVELPRGSPATCFETRQKISTLTYPSWRHVSALRQSTSDGESEESEANAGDALFDGQTTVSLVGGQSLLVVAAVIAAFILGTPNYGFGPGISFGWSAFVTGTLLVLPLAGIAAALDVVEDRFPALQDVTTATQRSVIVLLGGTFKPVVGILTAIALGLAAGFGEEMLFRGIFQYELASRFGNTVALFSSSLVFGLLHAVTPLYAALAGIASLYFGSMYIATDNLAVPIACHAIYDVGALMYAHWTVSQMSPQEVEAVAYWEGPGTKRIPTVIEDDRVEDGI